MNALRGHRCRFGLRTFYPDVITKFLRALGALPTLRHLQLDTCGGLIEPPCSFRTFSNLETINIRILNFEEIHQGLVSEIASLITRSPNVQDLVVQVNLFRGRRISLVAIFLSLDQHEPLRLRRLGLEQIHITPEDIQANIRHFGKLERLSIIYNPWVKSRDVAYGNIWTVLHQNHIHLHALTTDAIGRPEFVEYLTSYTGLQELVIVTRGLRDHGDIGQVNAVIAHHHKTLEILDLGAKASWSSCLWIRPTSEDLRAQLAGIGRCLNLRELAVHYDLKLEEVDFNHRGILVCSHCLSSFPCAFVVTIIFDLFLRM